MKEKYREIGLKSGKVFSLDNEYNNEIAYDNNNFIITTKRGTTIMIGGDNVEYTESLPVKNKDCNFLGACARKETSNCSNNEKCSDYKPTI